MVGPAVGVTGTLLRFEYHGPGNETSVNFPPYPTGTGIVCLESASPLSPRPRSLTSTGVLTP